MTTTLALFFLMMGSVVLVTVAVDPAGALVDPTVARETGKSRDVLSSISIGGGLLSFGALLLIFTLKRAGPRAVRWICRRCGNLFRVEQ
jgi:hypothetical protein